MTELINFRDFGGLPTPTGQRVRTDRLYRCGQLDNLGEPAIQHVLGMDFTVIADLRYVGEQESNPSPWPDSYAPRILSHGQSQDDAPHLAILSRRGLDFAAIDAFYLSLYRGLPFDPFYRPLFAQVMTAIAERPGRALIHCAAGKDRTGVLCALILETLGVDRETMLGDYIATRGTAGLVAMKPGIIASVQERHGEIMPDAVADALIGVKPDYIEAALARIEAEEGSVAAYLRASGVSDATQQVLRDQLLI